MSRTFDQAVWLHQQGLLEEAAALYQAALKADPRHVGSLHRLSVLRRQQGRIEESLRLIRKAASRDPRSPDVENSFGNTLQALGRHEEAIARFRRAIALRVNHADARNNLGNSLQALGRHEQALAEYRAALAIHPGFVLAHNGLGKALLEMGRHEEAIDAYDRALGLAPTFAAAHSNRGNALMELNRHAEALAAFSSAVAAAPDLAEAHWNESQVRLAIGDYEAGWSRYEWRAAIPELGLRRREFAVPRWRGVEDLTGRTLLLHAEQGLGDTLFFVRYAPLAAARGARVVLEVQAPLVALLQGLAGIASVHAMGEALPPFDLHCPLPSLPLAFGTTLETIPAKPYLAVPADRMSKWRNYLGPPGSPRIGLAWAGSPHTKHDRTRSVPLDRLRPLLEMPGCHFVALQKELRDGDAALLDAIGGILVPGGEQRDFADTAALVAALDLVIAVDTSVAHLAGALGKPVWVLLRHAAHWCWLVGREDSPWYPSARLFRQSAAGDWPGVVARVRQCLAEQFAPVSAEGENRPRTGNPE